MMVCKYDCMGGVPHEVYGWEWDDRKWSSRILESVAIEQLGYEFAIPHNPLEM